ncbi:hypothetical protein MTR_3g116530 [Medicago truncatula]|uniref:Uncharacterized protein n=1 Tax=Medicago truncatula TaxID=3880 RepID=G7J6K7_MEDTR|nr:hypothetical protein MTR_3g116530 [Medicago truncatula]
MGKPNPGIPIFRSCLRSFWYLSLPFLCDFWNGWDFSLSNWTRIKEGRPVAIDALLMRDGEGRC